MAYVDDLVTARNNIAALLKDITANPKPDYSIDGKSVSWGSYLTQLQEQLRNLDEAIMRGDGSWEIESRGIS